jgi:hypothetical protein
VYWDARFLMSRMPSNGRPLEENEEEEEEEEKEWWDGPCPLFEHKFI